MAMKEILFFLLLFIFVSCSKNNDSTPVSLQTVIIKGYMCRDIVGNEYGSVGNPDNKLGDGDNFLMSTYPNPSTDAVSVYIKMKQPASKTKLWIMKAAFNSVPNQSFPALGGNQFVSSGLPVFELDSIPISYNINQLGFGYSVQVHIDNKNISAGYYRLYFQADNIILWENIVVSK